MPGVHSTPSRDRVSRLPGARVGAAYSAGASLLAVLLGLWPVEVLACPACSMRAPESPVRSVLLLGGLVLTPFLLAGVGFWAARRVAREERP